MVISILDINCGNLGSLKNALDYLKIENKIIKSSKEIVDSECLILPGDGSFKSMNYLNEKRYSNHIIKHVQLNKPLLGICLGMQFFADKSMEDNKIKGFGFIPGEVKKFETNKNYKVPHIGYNSIKIVKDHEIFEGIKNNSDFYFIHSFYYKPINTENILAQTNYAENFASVIFNYNVIGVQFHPEKSQKSGLQFLKNFYNFSKKLRYD